MAVRVCVRIGELVPEGLGYWHPAGDLVVPQSDVFFDRLKEWEAAERPQVREEVPA